MNNLEFQLINGGKARVLVKESEIEQTTQSGLFIPVNTDEIDYKEAVIIKVAADEREEYKPVVKEGQQIIFTKYAGNKILIAGDTYLLIKESDIFGVKNV